MATVLIVDDEPLIREALASYLRREGYETSEAASGAEALRHVREGQIDLVVLDLMLPDGSGEDVCRDIRRFSPVPVLMLTAKSSRESRLQGLALGADDYVLKPFDPLEIVARIRAILRRADPGALLAERLSFRGGLLELDTVSGEARCAGRTVALTPAEQRLLQTLARRPSRVYAREELAELALGPNYEGDARTIDQHVKNIRQKLELPAGEPPFIETVYGRGYRFGGAP
ncbi:response regulator transcription factor [Paenibacillus albicereus]|uniref:Response regulator transcription factor n=1 Tax=Paenibacillus albicereus TaxID=2726185 RepID=A0A6H2GZ13_9BACL|nr:response regulator transcription factor [Paenibacillus albicereus]QJC52674.1 response regulator transcription factor [Paenibacillus albicereus]